MYAIELLSRQPDQAITALAFAVLKNIQGRKDADPVNLITRKNVFIFRSFAAQHDIMFAIVPRSASCIGLISLTFLFRIWSLF